MIWVADLPNITAVAPVNPVPVTVTAERGVREFSMAEASRRLGVTVAAPYRHFADRDDLLAAVGVRALDAFAAALAGSFDGQEDPVGSAAGQAAAATLALVKGRGALR